MRNPKTRGDRDRDTHRNDQDDDTTRGAHRPSNDDEMERSAGQGNAGGRGTMNMPGSPPRSRKKK